MALSKEQRSRFDRLIDQKIEQLLDAMESGAEQDATNEVKWSLYALTQLRDELTSRKRSDAVMPR